MGALWQRITVDFQLQQLPRTVKIHKWNIIGVYVVTYMSRKDKTAD